MIQAQGSTRSLVTEDHSMQHDTDGASTYKALAIALAISLAGLVALAYLGLKSAGIAP